MNIFALSDSPVLSAQYQHDKHVVKMTLETAQLLSTAARYTPPDFVNDYMSDRDFKKLYKPTHFNHPCSKWARNNPNNFKWLCEHGLALAAEFKHRFKHDHRSGAIIRICANAIAHNRSQGEVEPFAMAMPDEYKTSDPVLSYRQYYLAEKIKDDSKWTDRRSSLPEWLFKPAVLV